MITLSLTEGARWKFRDAARARWREAVVPGCVHRDLLHHRLIPDPFWGLNEHDVQWVSECTWEYRSTFEVPGELLEHQQVELVADGLDTLATVLVNGVRVGESESMFAGVRFPIRGCLRPGRNELLVRFASATDYIRTHRLSHQPREINDPVGGCTRIRKQQCQFGWDWAPRLVTAGIWRHLRIEAWTDNRLVDLQVRQDHRRPGVVALEFVPELARKDPGVRVDGTVALAGQVVAAVSGGRATVAPAKLWWPNGQGEPTLYDVDLKVTGTDGRTLGWWSRRIGLRLVELERTRDEWGESFQFVVNGRRIFAKGASWIPAHSLVGGLARSDYEPLLRSAVEANMNMIRVWGGGIYEHEAFYDLCDERGLLVWQDFMFACTLYPGDRDFLRLVRAEAEFQVKRLRHRACLALWCGNNELELLNAPDLEKPGPRAAYAAVFRQILPEAVARHDGVTAYWRSSPSQAAKKDLADPERSGNTHFWDVWHLLKPVKSYEAKVFRFVSEFGMQSFPSQAVAATFTPPGQFNIFSPVMENHQKNPMGNRILLEYIARRYRFPKDYAALAYLSQLNQAYCMQVGVEHYRRHQGRCAGTLYWQLNDCWPVASWSSLEFGGRWKALHHAARRFYQPMLVSAHVPGDETSGIGNRLRSTVREVHLHTISDSPRKAEGALGWELFHLDGTVKQRGRKEVVLRPGESLRQVTLDLGDAIQAHGADRLYLRIALEVAEGLVNEETVLLAPPRTLELQAAPVRVEAKRLSSAAGWQLAFESAVFQHRFMFELDGMVGQRESDNWFDLYPGRAKHVTLKLPEPVSRATLLKSLRYRSLVDSYE